MTVKNTEVNNGPEACRGLNATYDNDKQQTSSNEYGCSTSCSRNVPSRSCRRLKQSRDEECDVREYEQRLGKIGVDDLTLAPIAGVRITCVQVLNSDILRSYAQVRMMLLDYLPSTKRIRLLVMMYP